MRPFSMLAIVVAVFVGSWSAAAVVQNAPPLSSTSRVYQGSLASAGQAPSVVALLSSTDSYLATGVLLSEQWVATSAHSVYDNTTLRTGLKIAYGGVSIAAMIAANMTMAVQNITVHPQFSVGPTPGPFDLALLLLSEPLVLGNNTERATIAETDPAIDATLVSVCGYGRVDPQVANSASLYCRSVAAIGKNQCTNDNARKQITAEMTCAANSGCDQDDGAPAFTLKNVVSSVFSYYYKETVETCAQSTSYYIGISLPYLKSFVFDTCGNYWNCTTAPAASVTTALPTTSAASPLVYLLSAYIY